MFQFCFIANWKEKLENNIFYYLDILKTKWRYAIVKTQPIKKHFLNMATYSLCFTRKLDIFLVIFRFIKLDIVIFSETYYKLQLK